MNVPYVMSATKASSKGGLLTSGCDVLRSFLLNLGPQLEGLYLIDLASLKSQNLSFEP